MGWFFNGQEKRKDQIYVFKIYEKTHKLELLVIFILFIFIFWERLYIINSWIIINITFIYRFIMFSIIY